MGATSFTIGGRFSVEGSRKPFNRVPRWESLSSRAAERLHAEVAGKAGLSRDLDGPQKGAVALLERVVRAAP